VASAQKLGRAITGPSPQIIARIPQQGQTGEDWGSIITAHLFVLWLEWTPAGDKKIARAQRKGWRSQISQDAVHVLDKIIVRQAVTLGWRIELSELVRWRLSEWELTADGLGLLRRFHRAIERAARIYQRLEKPPIDDPGLYLFKIKTVEELRAVLKKMQDAKRARSSRARKNSRDLLGQFLKTIKQNSKSLPYLTANLARWKAFRTAQPDELRTCLSAVRFRPASLFNIWLSWCKGVDPEWLRQVISRLGSSLRKPVHHPKL
jgi:hypothetical protein